MKEFKSFYKEVGGNEGSKCKYSTRLDTYGCGCQHDCKYCYAKSLLSFRNLWDNEEPSVANLHKIENKLKRLPKGTILRLGGMTDCFQPCELGLRVTYHTIKLLNKYGVNADKMKYYATDYGYSFSESKDNAAYISLSDLKSWKQEKFQPI